MKTRMRMKALLGAAALQVAMVVTSTDWSSNATPSLACFYLWVSQPTSREALAPFFWQLGGGPGPGRGTLPDGLRGRQAQS